MPSSALDHASRRHARRAARARAHRLLEDAAAGGPFASTATEEQSPADNELPSYLREDVDARKDDLDVTQGTVATSADEIDCEAGTLCHANPGSVFDVLALVDVLESGACRMPAMGGSGNWEEFDTEEEARAGRHFLYNDDASSPHPESERSRSELQCLQFRRPTLWIGAAFLGASLVTASCVLFALAKTSGHPPQELDTSDIFPFVETRDIFPFAGADDVDDLSDFCGECPWRGTAVPCQRKMESRMRDENMSEAEAKRDILEDCLGSPGSAEGGGDAAREGDPAPREGNAANKAAPEQSGVAP